MSVLPQPAPDQLVDRAFVILDLSDEDRAALPPLLGEDVRKLFSIAVTLRNLGENVKDRFCTRQRQSVFDMIKDGNIDLALTMVERAFGGTIYHPLKKSSPSAGAHHCQL